MREEKLNSVVSPFMHKEITEQSGRLCLGFCRTDKIRA